MNAYLRLMRFDKPIGIYLLLWPTWSALWLASHGIPPLDMWLIFTIGVIVMRSAGCVANDLADQRFDALVSRTKNRPLITREISQSAAVILGIGLIILAFLLVLLTNRLTLMLAMIAVILALGYPFAKRITHLPQAVLGMAFAMSVPMAFAAINNTIPAISWLLFISTIIWAVIYDTMYAMADRQEDLHIGVRSSAILFGDYDKLILAILQGVLLILFILIGMAFQLEHLYYLMLLPILAVMAYHQFLIKDRIPEQCFKAFKHNHYIGLTLFIAIVFS